MRNNKILGIILGLLFVVVFNVVFFVGVEKESRTATVWVNYAFIHVAYILVLIVPKLSLPGKMRGDYMRPLFAVAFGYFVLALIASCVMIFGLTDTKVTSAWLTHILLLFIALAMVLFNMMANNHTEQQVERHKEELHYVRQSSTALQELMGRYADERLTSIHDVLRTSPVRTTEEARPVEEKVLSLIGQLEQAYAAGDTVRQESLIKELQVQAAKRNLAVGS